jgi:hypothetical protein
LLICLLVCGLVVGGLVVGGLVVGFDGWWFLYGEKVSRK